MDPLTAFSFTCNVITAVDAAVKCGRTIAELYDSTSGYTRETGSLLKVLRDWDVVERDLNEAIIQIPRSESHRKVQEAAANCAQAARQMHTILTACQAGRKGSLKAAVKGFFKTLVTKSEVARLRSQLDQSANRLSLHVASVTR